MCGMELPESVRDFFRRQGKIGAKRRYKKLSPEQRTRVARIAAQARWAKVKGNKSRSRDSK
jgi:hypothetical protein